MNIRPVDLPELRVLLARHLRSDWALEYWREVSRTPDYRLLGSYGTAANLRRVALLAADGALFHVAEPMAQLAAIAGSTLPTYDLQADDLPSPSGVMIFGGRIQEMFIEGEEREGEHLAGAMWTESPEGGAIWVIPLLSDGRFPDGWQPGAHGRLLPGGPRLLPYRDDAMIPDRPTNTFDRLIRTLRSAWLLMFQPLALTTDQQPDRAARKRAARGRYKPKPVRVIELRRPAHSGPGDGSREFHHQWIVRGHWRQQWYPARQVHRPVWIAPHIKGPEGAPLLGGEKVYAWKR